MTGGRRGLRRLLPRLVLLGVSVIVALGIAELALRLVPSLGPRSGTLVPAATPHPLTARTIVGAPSYRGRLVGADFETGYALNALGFRERELDLGAVAAARPYLFTGDSYFQGWGVEQEERVSDQFARGLAGPDPPPVVNLAFPGFGTFQAIDVIDRYAEALHPRLIIHGLFVGNDIIEDFNTLTREGATPAGAQTGYRWRARVRNALRTSSLVNLTLNSLWDVPWFRRWFDALEIRSDRAELYARTDTGLSREMYRATTLGLEQLADRSRRTGIPLLVVLIPDHLQVLRPDLLAAMDATRPQRQIVEVLARHGVPYLDLLEPLRASADPAGLFFRKDKHWNAKGHALVARLLLDSLRRTGDAPRQ
jgi:hypothetical protein